MTKPLAPEVVSPPSHRVYGVMLAAMCGLTGAAIIAANRTSEPPVTTVVEVCHATPEPLAFVTPPAPAPVVVAATPKANDPRAREVKLVFRSGRTTYMKLATIAGGRDGMGDDGVADKTAEPMPRHGKAKLAGGEDDDWAYTAVADVTDADVAAAYRAWAGREVVVDGYCHAKVTGFAVASRLTGETSYASVEGDEWNAKSVLDSGARMLVAKLDSCQGRSARDATLPEIVKPWLQEDASLIAAAKRALIASEAGKRAQAEWKANEQKGHWYDKVATSPEAYDGVTLDGKVLHHPTTNETFVSLHAVTPFACGTANVNVWGLYKVGEDGALTAVAERETGLYKIDQFLDVDGDGTFELVGTPLFDEAMIEASDGTVLESLERPYFGCPC